MELALFWHTPLPLRNGHRENLIYTVDEEKILIFRVSMSLQGNMENPWNRFMLGGQVISRRV